MTLPRLSLVASADPAPDVGQKSCANLLDLPSQGGRGRGDRRRARGVGYDLRRMMPALWGRYVRATFASREGCAAHFGVALQTACNWWDDLHAPAAAVYARASIEDGARLHQFMVGVLK